MRDNQDLRYRDAILRDFSEACPRPSADDVADWVGRHSDLADDIRAHAEALLAVADEDAALEPSPALLARGRGRALEILTAARAQAGLTGSHSRFGDLMASAGTDVPKLARALDIGRAPLVDLVQGRMFLPAPRTLIEALAVALGSTFSAVSAAALASASAPQMGSAKATSAPSAKQRKFADIVRSDATMMDERKAFWLSCSED